MMMLSMLTVKIVMVLSLCVAAGTVAAEGGFPLRVDDVSGLDAPWPLVGGLPFPRGALSDPAQIRILQGDTEVPAQIDVASRWRDGSIRWALAGLNASPQGDYRVEYGPGVSRTAPPQPLRVAQAADGGLTVDTGAAVYRFAADALLPQQVDVNGVTVLDNAGAGAYLIDNHGRVARVAGAGAGIETEILREGPVRTAIRREGWYVTEAGEQIARAKVWFYLTAGSPYLRLTHQLILTEDTNELWIRDYGLEFNTPVAPREVTFALSEPGVSEKRPISRGGRNWSAPGYQGRVEMAELFASSLYTREQRHFTVAPGGNEVYLLQDDYPHFAERNFRAVIAQAPAGARFDRTGIINNNVSLDRWLKHVEVAGDWAEGRYDEFGLCVVVPQLAQQFPKEIAFGPDGARVALWSGRSGRELDFRPVTLLNEYWQRWGEAFDGVAAGPNSLEELVLQPSNAQGAARTHDIWLLPRTPGTADAGMTAHHAAAASHRPLLRADPVWLCATEAIGWPMHPHDPERFADVESVLTDEWEYLMGSPFGNAGIRRTGLMAWGSPPSFRSRDWYRLFQDYQLHRHVWLLYARGGDRSLFQYGMRHSRWESDFQTVHWTVGNRRKGENVHAKRHLPLYWQMPRRYVERGSRLASNTPARVWHWVIRYWLTGDECVRETMKLAGDAYRRGFDADRDMAFKLQGHIQLLTGLLAVEHDDELAGIARTVAHRLIDLDNPLGICDSVGYGTHYKTSRQLQPLTLYYQATGDEKAREAVLKAMDHKFRFNVQDRTNLAGRRHGIACQHFGTFLWGMAYRWTGERKYLRKVNHMIGSTLTYEMGHRFGPVLNQQNPFMGVPTALWALANLDASDLPIEPYPLLAVRVPELTRSFSCYEIAFRIEEDTTLPPVVFDKPAGHSVNLGITIRVSDTLPVETAPRTELVGPDGNRPDGVRVEREQFFLSWNASRNDPRRWHFAITVPDSAPAGEYRLEFPDAGAIYVMDSDAPDIRLPGAPDRPTTIPRTRPHKIRYQ